MSKSKASGKTSQQTTRPGKRLGVKIYGNQPVKTGQIIVRQRGSKYHAGQGVRLGRDFTAYALKDGVVKYKNKQGKSFVEVI